MNPTSPSPSIDLNADLGEGSPWDEAILDRVSSANISCGAHAGDPRTIRRALVAARDRGVVVGAHPGYADPEHFGRRNLDLDFSEIRALILDQVASLGSIAAEVGVPLRFVKPHGALYNQAQADPGIADALVAAIAETGLPVVGQPASCVEAAAGRAGLRFVAEGFADRRYLPGGRLVPRSDPRAILRDRSEIEAQLLGFLAGSTIRTICLHGDNAEAVALADLAVETFRASGIPIRSFA